MHPYLIIVIGGTGQVLLHYYSQLFIGGSVTNGFTAFVVDTDDCLPSLLRLESHFANVRRISPTLNVPNIAFTPVPHPQAASVRALLTGGPAVEEGHPVSAIFESGDLAQSVSEGLFARPALSAVITMPPVLRGVLLDGVTRVLTVSSIVGGTGGGLTAPMLSHVAAELRHQPDSPVSLRCVFFGQYFQPDLSIVPDADRRFPSNELLALSTLQALSPAEMHQFTFIKPEAPGPRDLDRERTAVHLAWPIEGSPMWQGLQATQELLTQAGRPVAPEAFLDREVMVPRRSTLIAADAETALRPRVERMNGFVRHSVLTRLAAEPLPVPVWGRSLVDFARNAAANALSAGTLGFGSRVAFFQRLQGAVDGRWAALRTVFPNWPANPSHPSAISKTNLDAASLDYSHDDGVQGNPETFLNVTADNLIYRMLQGSEHAAR